MNKPVAPLRGPFLTAEWRNLLMLNYPVEEAMLAPHVPRGTELDTWDGSPFISLVGFVFKGTRVHGIAFPGYRDFEEVNLRFYVRRKVDDGWRRGVVFIREIVPRRLVAWIANGLYEENYVTARMSSGCVPGQGATYACRRRGESFRFGAAFHGEPATLIPGSPEEFFAEHYWGYTKRRDGRTNEYYVEHPTWHAWRVEHAAVWGSPHHFYGPEFAKVVEAPPHSALLAVGSAVSVFPKTIV